MQEIWKDIEEYADIYEVSTLGNVRNKVTGIMKVPHDNGHGYKSVSLSKNGHYKTRYVHRLVANAFIDNHENKLEVHHIDSDRSNNKLDNLQWVTSKENNNFPEHIKAMQSNESWAKQRKEAMSKARDKAIVINSYRAMFIKDGIALEFESLAEGARKLGLDKGNATRVANGKQVHTHGYVIEYVGKERSNIKSEDREKIKSGEMTIEEYFAKTTKETIKKAVEGARKANSKKTRFTKDGVSQEFNSLAEGSEALGLDKRSAGKVANGKQKSAKGYLVEFI